MSKVSKECLKCGRELRPDGECPNGCTEDSDYDVMAGYATDEVDIKIKSIASGVCQQCGGKPDCPEHCYDPSSYVDDTPSNIALEQGVCLICGGEVKCPNRCF